MIFKIFKLLTCLQLLLILFVTGPLWAEEKRLPIADIHMHFNGDQQEVTDTDDALQALVKNNVVFGIVSSKPPDLALKLADASGGWIIPFFMPYLEPERKVDWVFDDRVLPATRRALQSGRYKGIGELHLISGYTPSLKKQHAVIDGMLSMAKEFDVPILIHAEASNQLYFQPLCKRHPQARIVWVHAGSPLPPMQVAELLQSCPNVWVDLSARDHMRYGRINPIVDDHGQLLEPWREFVLKFQDRLMIGSDAAYYEGSSAWESANTGWNYIDEVMGFHRQWLSGVPLNIRKKITLENAIRFFRLTDRENLRQN